MKILVNGPSPARGPGSWPYVMAQHYQADLVNLSQAGAGNIYIADSTISELSQRKYDFVAIMWADLRRFDIKVSNIDVFNDTIYTAKHQKSMNDWPDKIVTPINDQDYVDDKWVFGCGYLNTTDPSIVSLFESYYKHTDTKSQYFTSYCRMLSLQGFLKSINQPYMFVGTRKLAPLASMMHLYQQLDFDHVINDRSVFDFARELNSWEHDKIHPASAAHEAYWKYLAAAIEKKQLLTNDKHSTH